MTMQEIKVNKGRRKQELARITDDVMPTNGMTMTNGVHRLHQIDEDERRRMIAEAAYYRALRRGFANGSPETDWLEAEAEIVALLANAGMRA